MRTPLCRILALLLLLATLLPAAPKRVSELPTPPAEAAFPGLQAAQDLAAEQSWTLARDAFAAALTKLEDPVQQRWCDFLLEEARQRAEPCPSDWQSRNQWLTRWNEHYERLLLPYTENKQPKDEFWASTLSASIHFSRTNGRRNLSRENELLFQLIDYRSLATATPQNAELWFLALHDTLKAYTTADEFRRASWDNTPANNEAKLSAVLTQLSRAAQCQQLPRERRAWALLWKTLLSPEPRPEAGDPESQWAPCLNLAKDTVYEPIADAFVFIRATQAQNQDVSNNSLQAKRAQKPDIPALLSKAKTLLSKLPTALQEPYVEVLQRTLNEYITVWPKPTLNVYLKEVPEPNTPFVIQYGTSALSSLNWSLYRTKASDYAAVITDPAQQAYAQGQHNKAAIEPSKKHLVSSGSIELPPAESLEWAQDTLQLLPKTEPGYYLLFLTGETKDKRSTLKRSIPVLVSSLSASLVTTGSEQQELWLEDKCEHTPLANKSISVFLSLAANYNAQNPKTETLRDLHTDEHGHVVLDSALLGNSGYLTLLVDDHASPALITAWLNSTKDEAPELVGDLFVERPLFRPGETVHWRFFLRERTQGHWKIPARSLRVIVSKNHPEEVLLDLPSITLDELGSAEASLELPATLSPCVLRLSVAAAGTKPLDDLDEDDQLFDTTLCTVDNFVPPPVTSQISLLSPPSALCPGSTLKFQVQANYYSGGPVQNASVKLAFSSYPSDYRHYGHLRQEFGTWLDSLQKTPLSAVTDSLGNATFELTIPNTLSYPVSLSARASVSPIGVAPIESSATWTLTPGALRYSTPETLDRLVEPKGQIDFRATLVDGTGKPAAAPLVLNLLKKEWVELWLSPEGALLRERPADFPLPDKDKEGRRLHKNWELLKASYDYKTVSITQLQVGSNGEVSTPLTLPETGCYVVSLVSDGSPLPPIPSPRTRYQRPGGITGEPTAEENYSPELFALNADSPCPALEPTEQRLLQGTPAPATQEQTVLCIVPADQAQTTLLLSIAAEQEALNFRVPGKQRLRLITVPLPQQALAKYKLKVSPLGPTFTQHWNNSELDLRTTYQPPTLELKLASKTAEARPGEKLEFTLQSSSPSGKALPAGLVLSVTDEALSGLTGILAPLSPTFLKAPKLLSVSSTASESSASNFLAPPTVGDPRPALSSFYDDEVVVLSPFEVSHGSSESGYTVSNTLAGTRLRTELRDASSSLSVITPSLMQDVMAKSSDELLTYTASTEVAGTQGNFTGKPKPAPSVTIRKHFVSTALWLPMLKTNAKGYASVSLKLPDNLTLWRARAYAASLDGQLFDTATCTVAASIPLQARLQTPRFLVAGDTLQLDSTVVNRTPQTPDFTATLETQGPLQLLNSPATQLGTLAASGETRLLWPLKAQAAGTALLKLSVLSDKDTDGMQLKLPLLEDGLQLPTAACAFFEASQNEGSLTFSLPSPLDPKRTEVQLKLSPSLAGTLLDALPYLLDYPYGCVEQTMSRFLPAVVVREVLETQGFDPLKVETRILARHLPAKKQKATLGELDSLLASGLSRLQKAQRSDGSFGWWPDSPYADLWMSAYVKWGLTVAQSESIEFPEDQEDALEALNTQLTRYLIQALDTDTDTDTASSQANTCAWALAALAAEADLSTDDQEKLTAFFKRLFNERSTLNARGRACLTLSVRAFGNPDQEKILLRNLLDGAVHSQEPGLGELVQWGIGKGYWHADEGAVESTAFTLMALLKLNPEHPLVTPAANWLLLNRKSANWSNTRDTAFSVLALSHYLKTREDQNASATFELRLNGDSLGEKTLTQEDLLEGGLTLTPPIGALRPGSNTLELHRRSGNAPLFASVLASAWSASDSTLAAGNLIHLARGYEGVEETPTLSGRLLQSPCILNLDTPVQAGTELRAQIAIQVPHDYEYLMIELPKAAGFEPKNPLSAWDVQLSPLTESRYQKLADGTLRPEDTPLLFTSRQLFREEHDDKSVIFIDRLNAGTWLLRLPLKAVYKGNFRILPARIEAMYVPEIRANTAATRVTIEARP